jgi:hypothetical protein
MNVLLFEFAYRGKSTFETDLYVFTVRDALKHQGFAERNCEKGRSRIPDVTARICEQGKGALFVRPSSGVE